MNTIPSGGAANAWVVIDLEKSGGGAFPCAQFAIELDGERKLYAAVAEGDWLVVAGCFGRRDSCRARIACSVGSRKDDFSTSIGC